MKPGLAYFRKILIISCRDFKSYFASPVAYIVIAAFLVIMSWMFFFNLSHYSLQNLQYQQFGQGRSVSITDGIIRPLYGNMNVIFLFLLPFITMRLFSEEKKLHTFELLMTSPVTLSQIVLGKFLSALFLLKTMLGITFVYPIILFATANPEWGPIVTSYLGTILLASCVLTLGVLFSAMTENQIVAGALTFGASLFLWLVAWATQSAGPFWGEVFEHLSIIGHYNNFSRGVIDTSDLIYYFSFIGIGLFLTHRVLDSYRWR